MGELPQAQGVTNSGSKRAPSPGSQQGNRLNARHSPSLPGAGMLGEAKSALELMPYLQPVMKAIAESVGPFCEVVLHDLTEGDVEHTIVAIENGHVTGRKVGGPATNLGLEFLRRTVDDDDFGYYTHTGDGRELRSSSVYFRNDSGRPIAVLCINVDMTPFHALQHSLAAMLDRHSATDRQEILASDINDVLDGLIESAVQWIGKPVALMSRDEKVQILHFLDRKGAFTIKHSVDRVADRLNVSRVTAYSYLDQSRSIENPPAPEHG